MLLSLHLRKTWQLLCWRKIDSSDPMLMLSILSMWLLYTCTLCTFVIIDHNCIRWSRTFWVWLVIHTLFGACPLLRRNLFAYHLQSEAHALINQSSQKLSLLQYESFPWKSLSPDLYHTPRDHLLFRLHKQLHSICFAAPWLHPLQLLLLDFTHLWSSHTQSTNIVLKWERHVSI